MVRRVSRLAIRGEQPNVLLSHCVYVEVRNTGEKTRYIDLDQGSRFPVHPGIVENAFSLLASHLVSPVPRVLTSLLPSPKTHNQ